MSTSVEYLEYIIEQLEKSVESIAYKPLFGEYGLYYQDKYFAAVCDNRLLIKITKGGERIIPDCPRDFPYEGAKEMFLIDEILEPNVMKDLIEETWKELPFPKKRKKKIKDDGAK